jgi:hypothetical protein
VMLTRIGAKQEWMILFVLQCLVSVALIDTAQQETSRQIRNGMQSCKTIRDGFESKQQV